MRRLRRERRTEGPDTVWLARAEERSPARSGCDRQRSRADGTRRDRSHRFIQDSRRRAAPSQNALRQNPAWHHAKDRQRGRVRYARHHRRSCYPR